MPRQQNPRNRNLKGKELDRYKYNWLLEKGLTPSQAQEYRRAGWEKIDEAIKAIKKGMTLSEKSYYKRKTEAKKAPKKEVKKRAKEKLKTIYPKSDYPQPPPGYHYAFYKKSGKYILRKNPPKKQGDREGFRKNIKHMVFIKDQTDDVNASDYIYMMIHHRKLTNDELKAIIRTWLYKNPYEGAIGKVRTYLSTSPQEEDSILRENSSYALILDERPGYHELLAVMATIAQGVYENERKQDYCRDIIYQVEEYSKRIYNKLAADKFI